MADKEQVYQLRGCFKYILRNYLVIYYLLKIFKSILYKTVINYIHL